MCTACCGFEPIPCVGPQLAVEDVYRGQGVLDGPPGGRQRTGTMASVYAGFAGDDGTMASTSGPQYETVADDGGGAGVTYETTEHTALRGNGGGNV